MIRGCGQSHRSRILLLTTRTGSPTKRGSGMRLQGRTISTFAATPSAGLLPPSTPNCTPMPCRSLALQVTSRGCTSLIRMLVFLKFGLVPRSHTRTHLMPGNQYAPQLSRCVLSVDSMLCNVTFFYYVYCHREPLCCCCGYSQDVGRCMAAPGVVDLSLVLYLASFFSEI